MNVVKAINERAAMGMSEAAALHTRLLNEAKNSQEAAMKSLTSKPSGPRRRGPLSRKIIMSLRRALKPVMLAQYAGHKEHSFVHLSYDDDDIAAPEQLMVSAMTFDKKKIDITNEYRVGIVITRHASERLIQFFRVREFERLDYLLRGAYLTLIKMIKDGDWEDDTLFFVDDEENGVCLGHFVVGHHYDYGKDGKQLYVVKTWVGSRSYDSRQREKLKLRGLEAVA